MAEQKIGSSEPCKKGIEAGSSSLEILNEKNEEMVNMEVQTCEKIVPKAGMKLNSQEEVYNLYIEYARQEGFGITKRSTRSGEDGQLKYYTLACVRGGKRISTAKNAFNPRLSTKMNCQAKINVIIGDNGQCTISRVSLEHNHALSPQKSRFQRCNKKMDGYVKRRLELNEYKAIKKILKSIVYEAMDIQEFEDTWLKMIKDYNVERNDWLNFLYTIRHRWAPIYVKGIFWAGMSTTQRSESINAFFDGYVCPTTSLKQFVEQYDNALKSKIEKENKADFASFNTSFHMLTDCHFEKQLQEAYTNEIFGLFQDELRGMLYCNLALIYSDGPLHIFQVTDIFRGKEGIFRRQVVFNVYHNEVELDTKCSCRLFEFKGIICRHICKVFIEKNVKELPPQYILPRWRKDIKRMHTYVMNCYDDTSNCEQKLRYNNLCSHFSKAAEIGAQSSEKYNFLMNFVDGAIEKLMDDTNYWESHPKQPLSEEDHEQHQSISSTTKFRSPLKVRTKGRPPSKRKKSKVEELIIRNKKKVKSHPKGNAQTPDGTQQVCTQESVVNSNSLPNASNMYVASFTLQNIGVDSSSQNIPSTHLTMTDRAK